MATGIYIKNASDTKVDRVTCSGFGKLDTCVSVNNSTNTALNNINTFDDYQISYFWYQVSILIVGGIILAVIIRFISKYIINLS